MNCLADLTPQGIKKTYEELEALEIQKNAQAIFDRIRIVLSRYISNGLECPSYICMNDDGVFSSSDKILPANHRLLIKNGFKVYRVRFHRYEYKCFKDFITWDDIDFQKQVYEPFFANGKELTNFSELVPYATFDG